MSFRSAHATLSLVVIAFLVAGCSDMAFEPAPTPNTSTVAAATDPSLLGQRCMIKFRPDACGGAADLPVPWNTSTINGADLTVNGTLLEMNDEWIVVETSENGRAEYWIPKEVVFFVRAVRPRQSNGAADEASAKH